MPRMMFQVMAVYQIFDYITLKSVLPHHLRFILPEGYQIVSKGEGYFVLLGKEPCEEFFIESPVYETQRVTASPTTLWLTPFVSSFSSLLRLENKEGNQYFAYRNHQIRLQEQKTEGEIQLFCEYLPPVSGRKLLLQEGKAQEIVTVQQEEESVCQITPTSKLFKKIKTAVFILYEGKQDGDDFEILVGNEGDYQTISLDGG